MANIPDGDIILVKINGKEYRTALYEDVQRFVPNAAVNFIVNGLIESQESSGIYNELGHEFILQNIPLDEYIDFMAMCNGSLSHFVDSLSSNIDFNQRFFSGTFDELVVIENPLWDE